MWDLDTFFDLLLQFDMTVIDLGPTTMEFQLNFQPLRVPQIIGI
jgi:hypothetical protein